MAFSSLFRGLGGMNPTQVNQLMKPLRYGGAALGGIGGYAADPEAAPGERLLHAGAGVALGGGALPGIARTIALAKTLPDAVVNGLYYSYLSSPDTIARANLGAAGATLLHGLEQFLGGNVRQATDTFKALGESADIWRRSIVGSPDEVKALRHEILGPAAQGRYDVPDEVFRDQGLTKWFTAGDNAAVYAMKKGGLSADEAMRMTLTGTPQTQIGESIVNMQSSWLKSDSMAKRVAAATLMPFARVGVMGIEQGLKRMPLIGASKGLGGPGVKALFTSTDPAAHLARGRQAVGASVLGGGAFGEEAIDPRMALTGGTLTGPGYLPYTIGREFKRQLQRQPATLPGIAAAGAGAVGEGVMEFSPLGFQPLGIVRRPLEEIPRRAIPSAIGDVAEAVDPAYGRKMGRGELAGLAQRGEVPEWMSIPGVGQAMGRIPGLRTKLPEEFAPVDVFGRPRLPSVEALPGAESMPLLRGLSRTLAPSRVSALPPAQNLRDPQQRQLYELGMRPGAPSQRVEMPGLGGKIEMPAQTVAQVQRLRGASRERTGQILSQLAPWLMTLPPQQRAMMTSYLNNYINQVQGRATQAGSLALALSGGGQLPRP